MNVVCNYAPMDSQGERQRHEAVPDSACVNSIATSRVATSRIAKLKTLAPDLLYPFNLDSA